MEELICTRLSASDMWRLVREEMHAELQGILKAIPQPAKVPEQDELLNIKQASALIHLAVTTLYNLARQQACPI